MASLVVRGIACLVTLDGARRVIDDGAVRVEGNRIARVGTTAELDQPADRVVEASRHLVMPGLVNTHHHLMQTLTRNVPAVQDKELFDWLVTLYEVWRELTPEAAYVSALTGFAELLLSGCTTSSDHHYLHPRGVARLHDEQVRAARDIGIRFHLTRGSMSVGRSRGGLPPDDCVEDEDAILKDSERVIDAYHDPEPCAMVRVALAPCSPFSVSPELMRQTAALAEAKDVRLHTHLAETLDEERYCTERFQKRPFEFMEELGWIGPRSWFAHAIHLNDDEIGRLARAGGAVSHCPSSNQRLSSGTARVPRMLKDGVAVSIGVDGSASNDSSNLFLELRQAMLTARGRYGVRALTARQAIELGTLGGARALGRDDVGSLEPGKAADFIGVRLDDVSLAGSLHDPVAALVFCGVPRVDFSIVNGRMVVQDGKLTTLSGFDLPGKQNALAREMILRAEARTGRPLRESPWEPVYR